MDTAQAVFGTETGNSHREGPHLLAEAMGVPPAVVWAAIEAHASVDSRGLPAFVQDLIAGHANIAGVGFASKRRLKAALGLATVIAEHKLTDRDLMNSPAACEQFLLAKLGSQEHECFFGLFLDSQHRLLRAEPIFQGTIDSAAVYPRVIVTRALQLRAAALVVAHNHPSGCSKPSQADERLTIRLKDALALVDIRLLDHLIVGCGEVTSLANMGFL